MTNYIKEYYSKIESGEIIVGKRIKQLYSKLIYEIDHPIDNWVFDIEFASRPITFIETFCRNSKGQWMGKPVTLLLWQKACLQAIYGFVDKDTKLRRVREAFVVCGRKNGKSTMLSGLGLFGMCSENGAQVLCSANKYQQARIIFDEAQNMVLQSPELSSLVRKRKTDMYMDLNFSSMLPLSKNSRLADGLNCSLALVDEVHENTDRYSYDVIKQSMSARQEPLIFTISTAGFVREGLYDILHDYGCNLLDDKLDGRVPYGAFLPFFYELDEVSEMQNPDMWIKANPSLGEIKSFDELKANVDKSAIDTTFVPTLKTKDFDIPENISGSWLSYQELNNESTFDIADFKGSYAIGGVDLSETNDLTCATLIMMHDKSDIKYVLQHYFIPEDIADKKIKEDKMYYDVWQQKGFITFCKGIKIDYSDVTAWFERVLKEYKVIPYWIYYDRWNSQYWFKEMASKGFQMKTCGQGYKDVSPAMKAMTVDFQAHLINYNNNPVTKWCLSNTAVKTDPAGNIKFDKSKNRKLRIDGTASLYDAYFGLMDNFITYKQLIKGK